MTTSVVITGLGTISALGNTTDQFWQALCKGQPGIGKLTCMATEQLKIGIGAEVQDFNSHDYFCEEDLPLLDRFSQFAVVAGREAVVDAGLDARMIHDAAAVIGTGCGGKNTDEETYQRLYEQGKHRAHPLTIPKGMPSAACSQVSMQLGIAGPVFSLSSACSSASHAVVQALLMIRAGLVDVAIAGGTEAPFTFGLMKSWESLRVLSLDTCRPFSHDRSGLVLGEGAGMVVLESLEHARKRGVKIYAELAGCGMSADAWHITDPCAEGAARAIRSALKSASINPGEVDYVNAHGTGTKANDVTETRALHLAFGNHAKRLAVSSTKSMHGHSLGAAGALEIVATALAMKEGVIPPTANFTKPGEGCDLDYVPNQAREMKAKVAISNSFAFGGLNAVLAVRSMD